LNLTLLCVIIVIIFVGTDYEENEEIHTDSIEKLDIYNEMQKIMEKNRMNYDKFNQNNKKEDNKKEDNIIGISKPIPIPNQKKQTSISF